MSNGFRDEFRDNAMTPAFRNLFGGSTFGGVQIKTNIYLTDTKHYQFRFPRSKKKRIRKKWSKDKRNWKTEVLPKTEFYQIGDTLIMHPAMLDKLKKEMQRQNENQIYRSIFGG